MPRQVSATGAKKYGIILTPYLNSVAYCVAFTSSELLFEISVAKLFVITHHCFNPLNAELNPICCLLALLGAHHFLHVSRIRVKLLTLRLLMSYIYMYIYIYIYI